MDLSERAGALGTARLLAAVLGIGPLLLLGAALAFPRPPSASPLVVPVGVLGLVAPAIAWRAQARMLEAARGGTDMGRRAYVRSVAVGLGITEAAAMCGVLVWLLSRQPHALAGLPMHLLMVGALWPTEERLRRAEEEATG